MSDHLLSKTSFLKFEQCPKAFFFYKNLPWLKDKISPDKEFVFKRGHQVGIFAQQLFPGGIDVSLQCENTAGALQLTAQLIHQKEKVIYEATFLLNGVLIMVDILCLTPHGYEAYEVKSSLRVSDVYLRDVCLQYYVLKQALPQFQDLFLVTLNPEFEKKGEVNPRQLFRKRSVKEKAELNWNYFEDRVQRAHQVLDENRIPNVPVGPHCFRPYQCDYFSVCWKEELSNDSIFHLPFTNKETQFEWHQAGHKRINQVPDEILRKESLQRIKQAFERYEPVYNLEEIRNFVRKVKAPVAAMDMEVWSPAIPVLEYTRPFEQIPFLAGFTDGSKQDFYFTLHFQDDRRAFAESLLTMAAPYETILVYDRNLELQVISSLQVLFPDLSAALELLRNKIVDVFDVFMKLHYYHPGFRNAFSLKVTSTVLLGISYNNIGSGLEAMSVYEELRKMSNPLYQEMEKQKLTDYCITDCRATLELFLFLEKLAHKIH